MKYDDLFLYGSLVDLDIGYWKAQRKLLPEDSAYRLAPRVPRYSAWAASVSSRRRRR